MENFIKLCKETRKAQNLYFAERNFTNLAKAKALEKRLDESLKIQDQKIINLKKIQEQAQKFNNGYQY